MKHSLPQAKRASTRTKALVTGGLVALTVAGVGGAAFASFTGSTSASQDIDSGDVTLTQEAGTSITVDANNIAAGDWLDRVVNLKNDGSIDITGIDLATVATNSSLLNGPGGLEMTIDLCSTGWVQATPSPLTYTCSGSITSVITSQPVVGSYSLTGLSATAGDTNSMKVRLTLPSAANDTFENQASTIQYTFSAVQRAGQAQ